jgi:hypothetical protein
MGWIGELCVGGRSQLETYPEQGWNTQCICLTANLREDLDALRVDEGDGVQLEFGRENVPRASGHVRKCVGREHRFWMEGNAGWA